jgi:hypothetical protein
LEIRWKRGKGLSPNVIICSKKRIKMNQKYQDIIEDKIIVD